MGSAFKLTMKLLLTSIRPLISATATPGTTAADCKDIDDNQANAIHDIRFILPLYGAIQCQASKLEDAPK
jgi:hypothetical protein